MGIRTKLLLVSLLFLAIPFMGYRFVKDMRGLIQNGLESALLLEAKAIATVLNERSELFDPKTGIPLNQENQWHLYAQPSFNRISIDGEINDWQDLIHNARYFDAKNLLSENAPESEKDISFWYSLAYDEAYIYALFQIVDDKVIFRNPDSSLNREDLVRIYMRDKYPGIKRIILTSYQPGFMSAYTMQEDWSTPVSGKHETDFMAFLNTTDQGYNVELRMPIDMVINAGFIGFAVSDVDVTGGQQLKIKPVIISTIDPERTNDLNKILLRSPQIEKILNGLDRPDGRVWVVDQYHRVRAVTGSVQNQTKKQDSRDFIEKVLDYLLTEKIENFKDLPETTTLLTNQAISKAFKNQATNFTRDSLDEKAKIVGAAYPIKINNKITGAVVVEQSTNEILASQNHALTSVVKRIAVIFFIAIVSLMWFATRLTFRINRLHSETISAIDDKGRINPGANISGARKKDELGALSASIKQMLDSLRQHTKYLERMPRTLRHEILNPLNILSTSVENLEKEVITSRQSNKYITSIKNGVRRLASILHSLTEASTLEQALEADYKEVFDLVELSKEYFDNYQQTHPDKTFVVEMATEPVLVFGWPESIAQMLDKVLDNAVDFSLPDTPIIINLKQANQNEICIYISNQGPHIQPEIKDTVFESMVSKRLDKQSKRPHLGIGLYVARVIIETHNGTINVRNTTTPEGVEFAICLPVKNLTD